MFDMVVIIEKRKPWVSVTSKVEFAYFEYYICNSLNFYPDKGTPIEWEYVGVITGFTSVP
jgi:hypothetical protein